MSELAVLPDLPVRTARPAVSAAPGRERDPAAFRRQLQALAGGSDRTDRQPPAGQAAPKEARPAESRGGAQEKSSAAEPAREESGDRPALPPADGTAAPVLVAAPLPALPMTAADPLPAAGSLAGLTHGRQGIAEAPLPRAGGAALPTPQPPILPVPAATGETEGAASAHPPVRAGDPLPAWIGEGKLPPMPQRAVDSVRAESGPAVLAVAASPVPPTRSSQPIHLAPVSPAGLPVEPPIQPEPPLGAERRGFLSEQRFAQLLTIGQEGRAPQGEGAVTPQGGEGAGFDLAEESFAKTLLTTDTNRGAALEETGTGGEPLPGPFGRLIESAAGSERLAKEPALLLPSGRSATEQSIVEQVVAGLPLPRRDSPNHLRLRLQPEELGQVTVELVLEKEGVKAHVQVQNQQVLEVLEKYLPRLREALQEQGVRLDEMRLSTDGHGSGSFARDRQAPSPPRTAAAEPVATGGSLAGEPLPARPPGDGLSIRV